MQCPFHLDTNILSSFLHGSFSFLSPGECSTAWKFEGQAYSPDVSETTSKLVLKPFGMPVYGGMYSYWIQIIGMCDSDLILIEKDFIPFISRFEWWIHWFTLCILVKSQYCLFYMFIAQLLELECLMECYMTNFGGKIQIIRSDEDYWKFIRIWLCCNDLYFLSINYFISFHKSICSNWKHLGEKWDFDNLFGWELTHHYSSFLIELCLILGWIRFIFCSSFL